MNAGHSPRYYMKLLALFGVFCAVCLAAFGLFIFSLVTDNEDGLRKIGDSDFYKKDGQIYAMVAGGGYMPVQGADGGSFRVLGQKGAKEANSAGLNSKEANLATRVMGYRRMVEGSNSKELNLTQPNSLPQNLTRSNSLKQDSTQPNFAPVGARDVKNLNANTLNTDAKDCALNANLPENKDENHKIPLKEMFYRGSNLAADKNAVYCGNLPLSGLNARFAKTFAKGYVSDGKISYFCDANSVANEDLGVVGLFLGTVAHALFDAPKPQVYIHKFKRINAPYMTQIMDANYATDGVRAYYKGEILKGADPLNLSMIKGANGRESDFYSSDKEGVYFGAARLDVQNSAQEFEALSIGNRGVSEHYLFAKDGEAFAGAHKFKPEAAPYIPLNKNDDHAYHLFFLSKEGVFYFDWKEKEQKRAGDNPFKGVPKPLSGSVFEEGGQIYFFAGREIWGNRARKPGLKSRNSALFALKMPHAWHKIGDVHKGTFGAVYANGGRYFYFDDLGHSQLSYAPIYEIKGEGTLDALLGESVRVGEIRNMIKEGKLTAVEGEMLFEVKTSYRKKFWNF